MPASSSGTRLFLKQARLQFLQTGAVAPSSRFLARAISSAVASGDRPLAVLEAGAGTGALTGALVRRLPPGSSLDLYEMNPAFARHLEERYGGTDGNTGGLHITVHNRRVQEIPPVPRYDAIVSGLPLNNFAPQEVEELLHILMSALKPGGTFSYFEYFLVRGIKAVVTSAAEKKRLRGVGEVVGRYQRLYEFRSESVLLNIPPALVHHLLRPFR